MKTRHILSTALLLIGLSQATFSQETSLATNTPTSTATIDDQLKSIQDIVSKLPQIGGLVDFRYQYATSSQNYNSGKNGFDIRRAYLNLKGNATKELSYYLQVDFAGTPKILDAYAEWKPSKYIGLQAGQFKVPYTLENPYSPNDLETIDNSQAITALVTDIAGNKNNGRDIGVSLNGSLFAQKGYNLIDYKLGVFNGNVINATDNNTTKDIVGNLLINPIKPLTLAISDYKGQYGPQATKSDRDRTAFGLKYDDGKFLLRSEYIEGKTGAIKSDGYYVTAGYYVTKALQPVLKYDYYDADKSNSKSPITNYVAGLNYWIAPKVRLQFNYTLSDYKDSSKSNTSYYVAQLLYAF